MHEPLVEKRKDSHRRDDDAARPEDAALFRARLAREPPDVERDDQCGEQHEKRAPLVVRVCDLRGRRRRRAHAGVDRDRPRAHVALSFAREIGRDQRVADVRCRPPDAIEARALERRYHDEAELCADLVHRHARALNGHRRRSAGHGDAQDLPRARRPRDPLRAMQPRELDHVAHEEDERGLEGPVALADVEAHDRQRATRDGRVGDERRARRPQERRAGPLGVELRGFSDEHSVEGEKAEARIAALPRRHRRVRRLCADVHAETRAGLWRDDHRVAPRDHRRARPLDHDERIRLDVHRRELLNGELAKIHVRIRFERALDPRVARARCQGHRHLHPGRHTAEGHVVGGQRVSR